MFEKDNFNELLLTISEHFPKKPTEFKWVNDRGTYCIQFPRSILVGDRRNGQWIDGISWDIINNQPTNISVVKSDTINGYVDEFKLDELNELELNLLANKLKNHKIA